MVRVPLLIAVASRAHKLAMPVAAMLVLPADNRIAASEKDSFEKDSGYHMVLKPRLSISGTASRNAGVGMLAKAPLHTPTGPRSMCGMTDCMPTT